MSRIFVSDAQVERWLRSGDLRLEGEVMRIQTHDGGGAGQAVLSVRPAVYFERIDGNEIDAHDLVGAVRNVQELLRMGAEHYETAVVLGDIAYTVRPGFSATPIADDRAERGPDSPEWSRALVVLQRLAARVP